VGESQSHNHSDGVSESTITRQEKTLKVMCCIDSKKIIDILRLHDTLRDFVPVRTLEIANEESSEVVELGGHIGVLGAVTHVSPGLVDVEHERIKESE